MSIHFGAGNGRRFFCWVTCVFVLGAPIAECQEPERRQPNLIQSFLWGVGRYFDKLGEAARKGEKERLKERDEKFKDIIEFSKNKLLKEKNIKKEGIGVGEIYRTDKGWIVFLHPAPYHHMRFFEVHVSSDKSAVKLVAISPIIFGQ